ncbi:hypothetical protein [Bradyrhizobium sp.]|uniref:hypothetical protein n=1 Tax=Bradyrhizobium sp. TaxID=376 RepID=UPI00260C5B1A|nr:hypothetical protein [Bradyrhizobium sp.]
MLRIFGIRRPSNTVNDLEEKHLEQAWAAINGSRQMLVDNPSPDTFLGRRTQEPFPREGEGDE